LRSYAYVGVTRVFDPGDASGDEVFARSARVASGELIGPRIFTARPIVRFAGGHPVSMVDALVPSWLRWWAPEIARLVPYGARTAQVVDEIALFLLNPSECPVSVRRQSSSVFVPTFSGSPLPGAGSSLKGDIH
jgi:hypothetical protein